MTKREAKRRLENLALEAGHKRNYYVKRALLEFLDRNEHLLGNKRARTNGYSTLGEVAYRFDRFPI
ncbi:MAG TPA: hypothetical protein VE243_04365 [Candidatus Acidoferrum sp.]|nr:hypothetical protein [Candidatus Acidoferrum sp.]